MLERQREGIARPKREGRYKDRVPTKRRQAIEIERLKAQGVRNRRQAGYRGASLSSRPASLSGQRPIAGLKSEGARGPRKVPSDCGLIANVPHTYMHAERPDALPFAKVSVIGDRHDRPLTLVGRRRWYWQVRRGRLDV